MGVKSPQPFDTLFDSLRWAPFSLALHSCSSKVITKWSKIYTKQTPDFKNHMRNLDNFRQAVESAKSWNSMGYICLKTTFLHLKHYLQIYKITLDWFVVWKMTWGIWQIFSRALKIGILMGSFNPNFKKYELKIQRSYLSSQWRIIQNLKTNWIVISKVTCGKWRILTWALLKVSKLSILMGSFWAKYTLLELKKYRGLSFMKVKRDTKFGEESTSKLA